VRAHLRISGRVQGVYFRESTRQEAEKLGVTGWVRNLADGRVEAVFEGPEEAVEKLVAWARIGPPRARVAFMDVERGGNEEGFPAFEVRRTG